MRIATTESLKASFISKRNRSSFILGFQVKTFPFVLVVVLFALLATANAQTLTVTRPDSAYHPDAVLDPATLLSADNFTQTDSGRYVVVEGYIDYYATTWKCGGGWSS